MHRHAKKIINDKTGAAMALVLIIMLVLSLLGTALWHYARNETFHANIDEKSKQAYYLARTGAEAAMAAWMEEPITTKPEGEVERVYYNLDTGEFQNDEPDNSGGFFDVTIEKITDINDERYGLTEIEATGNVDGYKRKVKLVTYPFTYGHQLSPAWYHPATGIIDEYNFEEFEQAELVVIAADGNLTLRNVGGDYGSEDPLLGSFAAAIIAFESPLIIDIGNDIFNPVNKTFTINAENIFFHDLVLSFLPERSWGFPINTSRPERQGRLILRIPENMEGISYNMVPGGTNDEKYGRVYFDGQLVQRRQYRWQFFILFFIEHQVNNNITGPNGENLAGNAYFFKDGTDILNLQPGDLTPIIDAEASRPMLRDAQPYFWE